MAEFDRTKLIEMFRTMASEVAEREYGELTEDSLIADLGLDSLQTLEIIGQMEQELSVQIPDDELVGLEKLGQLLEIVAKRVK